MSDNTGRFNVSSESPVSLQPYALTTCDVAFGLTSPALASTAFSNDAARELPGGVTLHKEWVADLAKLSVDDLIAALPAGVVLRFVVVGVNDRVSGTSIGYIQPLADGTRAYVFVQFMGISLSAGIVASSYLNVREAFALLEAVFPKYELPQVPERPRSVIRFWQWGRGAPESIQRTLDVVRLDQVEQNYPEETLQSLKRLVRLRPRRSGQLLLLHGLPGTGKTYCIRTLAWEWRDWCSIHYIMDVPTFLGGPPEYLNGLLFGLDDPLQSPTSFALSFDEDEDEDEDDDDDEDPSQAKPPHAEKSLEQWRLIVLEDSGELLATNAKEQTGQSLARLLNAADGLLGQGARVMFLITTNERLDQLHPAVVRPGRCLANIEFGKFDRAEAAAWLKRNGAPEDLEAPPNGGTLAELYELLERRQQIVAEGKKRGAPLGFGKTAA